MLLPRKIAAARWTVILLSVKERQEIISFWPHCVEVILLPHLRERDLCEARASSAGLSDKNAVNVQLTIRPLKFFFVTLFYSWIMFENYDHLLYGLLRWPCHPGQCCLWQSHKKNFFRIEAFCWFYLQSKHFIFLIA